MNTVTSHVMERVATKQAAKELNMDIENLQYMLRKGRLPIGYAVKKEGKKRTSYYIYRGLLNEYKKHLSGKTDKEYGEKESEKEIFNG